jgi:hypothetical protein
MWGHLAARCPQPEGIGTCPQSMIFKFRKKVTISEKVTNRSPLTGEG